MWWLQNDFDFFPCKYTSTCFHKIRITMKKEDLNASLYFCGGGFNNYILFGLTSKLPFTFSISILFEIIIPNTRKTILNNYGS